MASILSLRPNKLLYPGGSPGVNPLHPASQNLVMSVVSGMYAPGSSVSFQSLNGTPIVNTPLGTPASLNAIAVMDPILGPATYNNSATVSHNQGVVGLNATPSAVTIAVMFTLKAAAANGSYQNMTTYAAATSGLWLVSDGVGGIPTLFTTADNRASFTLTVGHTYFLGVSCAGPNVSGSAINIVAKDLRTGQVLTTARTNAAASSSGDQRVLIGEDSNEPSFSAIAASMYSRSFLTMPQLLQWAEDPWSFWYPPKVDLAEIIRTPPVVGASGGQDAWRQRGIVLRQSPSKLKFPGAVAPGIDPTHPAAKGIVGPRGLSIVANSNGSSGGGVYRDLVRNKNLAALSLAQNTLTLDPMIGPAIAVTGVNGTNVSTGNSTQADPDVTIAAIILFKTSASSQVILSPGGATSTNAEFYIAGTSNIMGCFGSGGINSTIALTSGRPYFVAVSASGSAGANFVALDLLTGSLRSQFVAGTVGSGTTTGEWWIGTDGFGNLTPFPIAAVMYAPTFMSMPQLLQWAQDPWSFWYPQALDLTDLLSTPIQVSVGLVPGLLQARSGPGLGPNSYHISLLNAALPTQVVAVPPGAGTLPFMGVG